MAKKSLIEKLKEKGVEFLGNAKCDFGYYVARPLICGGLIAFAGIQLADQLMHRHYSAHETSPVRNKQTAKLVDLYKDMTPGQAIKYVDSYEKARDYVLNHLNYQDHKGMQSFEETHRSQRGVCREASQSVLFLLSDNTDRYDAFLMLLTPKNTNDVGHAVALVKDKEKNKFGSLGINRADCIEPTYDSLKEVYNQINQSFSNTFLEDSCGIALSRNTTNLCALMKYNLRTEKLDNK